MAKVDRIIRRRAAKEIGRGIVALERMEQQAYQMGFMKGREYQQQLQREEQDLAKQVAESIADGSIDPFAVGGGGSDVSEGTESGGGVPDESVRMSRPAEVSQGAGI